MRHVPTIAAVATLTLACGAPAPPPPPPAGPGTAMLGRWEYVAPPGRQRRQDEPSLNAGLSVAIEIDSAAGRRFYGRVATWFAGDLGLAPTMFGRIVGEVSDTGTATFTIPLTGADAPAVVVTGTVRGDTLAINETRRGDEPGPFATAGAAAFVRRR